MTINETIKAIITPARAIAANPVAFIAKRPKLGDMVRMHSDDGTQHLTEVVVEDIHADTVNEHATRGIEFVKAVEDSGVTIEQAMTLVPDMQIDFAKDMIAQRMSREQFKREYHEQPDLPDSSDIAEIEHEKKLKQYMQDEMLRERGYDIYGHAVQYSLRKCLGTDGGEITNSVSSRTVYLQGDSWYTLCDEVEAVWKKVAWKKMGQRRAQRIINEMLAEYFMDED